MPGALHRVVRFTRWGLVVGVAAGLTDGAFALRAVEGLADRLGTMCVAIALHALLFGLLAAALALPAGLVARRGAPASSRVGTKSSRVRWALLGAGGLGAISLVVFGPGAGGTQRARTVAGEGRPNIVLISIDTLRADRVGAYDRTRETTPNLDRLAREGVVFDGAYSNASWTLPAHASMLTGLEPFAHGAIREQDRLASGIETLAERLRQAGYDTQAWVGTDPFGYVGAAFGFAAGFEQYRHYPHPERFRSSVIARAVDGEILRTTGRNVGNARAEIDSVVRWLRASRGAPFFLFLHFYDVHSKTAVLPYEAPPPFRDRFCPGQADGLAACREGRCATDRLIAMSSGSEPPFRDEELEIVQCLYDGGVAFVDHELGRLFFELDAQGLAETTVVVVTSDHGEAFFEHGAPLHTTLHEEVVRVPLIVRAPGGAAGKRAGGLVTLADVAPTLLELAGLEPGKELQGRSLAAVLREWPARATGSVLGVSLQRTLYREGDMKYIEAGLFPGREDEPRGELYELSADARERQNRIGWDREVARQLADALALRRDAGIALGRKLAGGTASEPVALGDAERDRLRALGYLSDEERKAGE